MEKKGHMGDFYRHLFRSNVAFGAEEEAAQRPKAGEAAAGAGREPGDAVMPERRAQASAAAVPAAAPASVAPAAEPARRQEAAREEREKAGAACDAAAGGGKAQAQAQATEVREEAGAPAERRNRDDAVAAARERYLARKRKAPPGDAA